MIYLYKLIQTNENNRKPMDCMMLEAFEKYNIQKHV